MAATLQDSILLARPNGKEAFVGGLLRGMHGPGTSPFLAQAIDCDDFERAQADFISLTLAGEVGATLKWQEVDSAGTTPYAKQTPTALLPSNILAAIDATTLHAAQLNGQKMATGFLNAAFFVKGEVDVITNLHMELGFQETLAASAANNITAVTTPGLVPTFVDTGAKAMFVVDTGFGRVESFVTQGNGASPAGQAVVTAAATTATSLVAGAEFIIGVVLRGADAYLFANFNVGTTSPTTTSRLGLIASIAGGITGITLMTPSFTVGTIGANAKNPQVDFLDFYQQRTAAPY